MIVEVAQRSPEWFAVRAGILTGSLAKDATSSPSTAAYRNAKAKLVVERLTGKSAERNFTSAAIEQGKELEPVARAAYEALRGVAVREVGFILSDEHEGVGCSPDGVIGDFEGEVQIKCPQHAAHLLHLAHGIPDGNMSQLLHHLWVTPRLQWIDFVSYNPDFPPAHRLYVCRLLRPPVTVERYASKALAFLKDVAETAAAIAARSDELVTVTLE